MYKLFNRKHKVIIGCLCMIIVSCTYSPPYHYNFSLIDPQNKTMDFEDSNVQFRFAPSPEKIWMSIKNKTDHDINLVRDKAEFIDQQGESHLVIYGNDFENDVRRFADRMYLPPMYIDSGSEISGYVWINIGLDYDMTTGRRPNTSSDIYYLMQPFFPRYSHEGNGEELKDSTFNLIMPIDFDGKITNYMFTFMINDVTK